MADELIDEHLVGTAVQSPRDRAASDYRAIPRLDVPGSFAELYKREFDPMVRIAALMGADRRGAEDVVQDAFAALLVKWKRVRGAPFLPPERAFWH